MDVFVTAARTRPAAVEWVPVDACTLPTAEQPLRVAEFDDLFAAALRTVERASRSVTRARLVLVGDETLPGRVQRLADAESACCSFFTFTLTPLDIEDLDVPGEAAVVLDIDVPPARAGLLDALVERAVRARGSAA